MVGEGDEGKAGLAEVLDGHVDESRVERDLGRLEAEKHRRGSSPCPYVNRPVRVLTGGIVHAWSSPEASGMVRNCH